jgi:CubicO group peptidase (beta-lactamase class C family)
MTSDSAATPQARVQDAVDRFVADGGEVGLQVAVIHRGDLVVDAVAGLADAGRGVPVTPDTLFFATSTAKGVASAVAHVLVERGDLTYDLRVADVWPEFAGQAALVSPDRLTELARTAYEGPDEVIGIPSTTWAFGFSQYRPGDVPARSGSTFGMAGGNGSAAWADIDSGLAVAVMRNRFSSDWSIAGFIDRLVAELFSTQPGGEGS